MDCKLEDLGLEPYICGYLGRGRTINYDGNIITANKKLSIELKEKYNTEAFTFENGRIICIQAGNSFSNSEAAEWKTEVTKLFKASNTVKTCNKSFPEKEEYFDIVRKKLNYHLMESIVIAYTCDDPRNKTEVVFAYEEECMSDVLVSLTNDIEKQNIIRRSLILQQDDTENLQILNTLKFASVDSKIDGDRVHVVGFEEDVNKIMDTIRSLSSLKKEKIVYLHEEELAILKMNAANKFIKKQVEKISDRPDLRWIIDGSVVRIIGPDEDTVNSCTECVEECFESRIFKDICENVLSSSACRSQLDRLRNKFDEKLVIKCGNDKIKITSTSDIHEEVVNEIKQFLERFTPDSIIIQSDRHKLDFFEESCRVSLENTFKDELVQIKRESHSEVRIDGTTQGISEVRRVIDTILVRVAWVARPDVIEFLQSEEGNRLISVVKEKYPCTIRAGHRDTRIQIVLGNIEEQMADVIVNSAAPDLTLHKGMVATCLSRTAGAKLQEDIQRQYPKGVQEGKVVRSEVGRLPCKKVYHAIPVMNADEKKAIETVKDLMNECLTMANVDKYESIAFPVFGTGTLDYPPDKIAQAMYDVARRFALENPESGTTLKEISIIMFPENSNVIKAFEAVKKEETRRTDDCRKERTKLLMDPKTLLTFYVQFVSNSKENIENALRYLEEHLP
ncbi:hypothetical protein CHS0354_014394 [Potamilus streckersoni]|uniref:Macro domain-containing protein n=1 Tax=Potamilus streckersoni TaxID=2493646 RepID=A0AAE0VT92_9BIVA|nr:hypothetical protein CHS0354_014394 [Potamilus streckersoni]